MVVLKVEQLWKVTGRYVAKTILKESHASNRWLGEASWFAQSARTLGKLGVLR